MMDYIDEVFNKHMLELKDIDKENLWLAKVIVGRFG